MLRSSLPLLCVLTLPLLPASAQTSHDIHVDPVEGADSNDGRTKPVRTIARGIKLAGPGDIVHLEPALYHESVDLTNKHGEPGNPITVDGHGAVLDGSEPLQANEWDSMGNGLFSKEHLMRHMDDAIVVRWFFLWDGKMNHMGRTSKGPKAPFKKPEDLQPGEWTYDQDTDTFYVRIPPGQNLDSAHIRYPALSSGVIESMSGSHLVVRNTISTHVYNDGYNIHGEQRDCVFEHIASIECGDDGFSAHEDGDCHIDGYVSIGNSTGLCDTVSSSTHYKNVFIRDCLGYDVFFIGDSPHSIENAIVESSAATACAVGHSSAKEDAPCFVQLRNVLFDRVKGKSGDVGIGRDGKLRANHCTFRNLSVTLSRNGEASLKHCLIEGEPKPKITLRHNTLWTGEGNAYDLSAIVDDTKTYDSVHFHDFEKLLGSETGSSWPPAKSDAPASERPGADEASLAKLRPMADEVVKQWMTLEQPGSQAKP